MMSLLSVLAWWSALACALGGSDYKVAVVEAQPLKTDWPAQSDNIDGFDAVSAL